MAIQQSKMAQLYLKQASNTATQTDVNIAYAPVTMEEIQSFIAAQAAISTISQPKQNLQSQSQTQNQWTQQLPTGQTTQQPKKQTSYNNPNSQQQFFQQLQQMLGVNTMPPSQVQGALPSEPTGMIQTPINPTLQPQLRKPPPQGAFTNLTPQQKQQILQILNQEQATQLTGATNGTTLLGTNGTNQLGATNGTNLLGKNGTNLLGTNGTNILGATNGANLLRANSANLIGATGDSNVLGTNATNLLGTTGAANSLGTQAVNTVVNLLGDTPATNTSLVIVKVLSCTSQYTKHKLPFTQSTLTGQTMRVLPQNWATNKPKKCKTNIPT